MKTPWTGHRDQRFGGFTYSQHGEDLMIVNLFDLAGIQRPSFLDVGAHHPLVISNTALLYERGSRGINIEANPNLFPEFQRQRPEDINLQVAVGPAAGRMPLYMVDPTSGLNSLIKSEVEKQSGKSVNLAVEVDVVTLNSIVDKHWKGEFPDFLSIDVEGMDLEVLSGADFSKSKPKVIIAEIRRHETLRANIAMGAQGYMCLCRITENLIYLTKEFWSKVF